VKHGWILLFVAICVGTAVAQPKDPAEAAYQEGRRLYDLRDWDNAIAKFKEAYKLHPDDKSLFNIAQSYRLKGDCVEAVGFYKTYKRNYPSASNIAAVDKFITELEPCAQKPPPATTATTATASQPPTQPEPVYEDRGAGKRSMGLIIGGAGLLVAGTGVAFGLIAKSKESKVEGGDGTQMWDPSIETSGKRFDMLAKVSWGIGGAAIVGGTVLFVMGKSSEHVRVSAAPSGGALVGWAGAW
jgi:tetratricopeptide (TPR) repeat protein